MLDHQRELAAALGERDARLASIYLGCLRVLADGDNPDGLPLAAHGARELMRAVPAVLEVPMKALKERMGDKARALAATWNSGIARSSCYQEGQWSGPIDKHLNLVLQDIHAFFSWMESHLVRRKAETIAAIRRLESANSLPGHIEEANATTWERMVGYFNNVAHHDAKPDRRQMEATVGQLEQFLLARLRPRTFEDFAEIDALLGKNPGVSTDS